ncbi:helix-turn-helix domain-containing protein [bacterium]|nr:helix-turn-helix domain-containing protein [bacterium]
MNENQAKDILRKNFRLFMWQERLKQKEIAEDLGLTAATVSNFANGKTGVHSDYLVKISQKYNVSIDWLLLNKGEMYLPKEKLCA